MIVFYTGVKTVDPRLKLLDYSAMMWISCVPLMVVLIGNIRINRLSCTLPATRAVVYDGRSRAVTCASINSALLIALRHRPHRPKAVRSFSTSFIVMLLLLAGVESNPGPPAANVNALTEYGSNIGFINIQSAVHKAASIHDIVEDYSLDLLALVETWIVEGDPDAIKQDIAPPGFRCMHSHRIGASYTNRGGGLAVVYRDSFTAKSKQISFSAKSFEYQLVDLTRGRTRIVVCNLYRPPSSSSREFFEEFSELLGFVCTQFGERLVITGDFNLPGVNDSLIDDTLASLIVSYDLVQHVHEQTRWGRNGTTGNLLDLIITVSTSTLLSPVGVYDAGMISDHRLLVCTASMKFPKPQPVKHTYRDLKNIDVDKFKESIVTSVLFSDPATNCDGYVQQIEDVVTEALDRVAPIRTKVKPRGSKSNSWLTPEAVAAKRKRRRLERKWLASRDDSVRTEYRHACRDANKKINESRRKHFADRMEQNTSNPRRLWNTIKQLLHPTSSSNHSDSDENASFCNKMADFFHKKDPGYQDRDIAATRWCCSEFDEFRQGA